MKAVITTSYGSPNVLKIRDVQTPQINPNEVLVKVHAASVNPVDWKVRNGSIKFISGKTPPKILGGDFAGTVAEIGQNITQYKVGDKIFGLINAMRGGAYAEYVKVKQHNISHMPGNLTFEEAAAIPLAGLTAYQSLLKIGNIQKGFNVLVNGCSGGVGTFGVQIAKALGAKVTGVCSTNNVALAKKIGSDIVIDYKKEYTLDAINEYDIFFDAVANKSLGKVKKTLKKSGRYITTLPTPYTLFWSPLRNITASKKASVIWVKSNTKDLGIMKDLVESKKVFPVIHKVYPVEKVSEAHAQSETGRTVGKLVLKF